MKEFKNKKLALAYLDKNALSCVEWREKGKMMSAIYWNGKLRIQPSDQKIK